jgi:hypothetical protein
MTRTEGSTVGKTCTFAQLTEAAKQFVVMQGRKFTKPDDDWTMALMLVHPGDQRPQLIRLPGWVANDDDFKDAYGHALGVAARITKPLMVAMIQSTWVAPVRSGDIVDDQVRVMPRDHPDRVERVLVVVLDTEIEQSWFATVKRRRRRPPVLEPWEQYEADGMVGRLIDPLREALR